MKFFFKRNCRLFPQWEDYSSLEKKKCVVNAIADELKVTIDCNVDYSLSISQEWITEAPNQEMKDEFDFWKGKTLRFEGCGEP